ncbi:hypothetical protein IV54_GL000541 [Levilactobacillus paucivorans]|uniref:Uncharacterized protein n=1 Tax=Levilactobacillus paucivorans TaxID=616990 RepID=A0A0R2LH97_9LACO|nr:hypothetical protein IV54_GL000541 [Levilactobacillus paucivorans]
MDGQMVTEFVLEGELMFIKVFDTDLKGMIIDLHVKIRTDFQPVVAMIVGINKLPRSDVK